MNCTRERKKFEHFIPIEMSPFWEERNRVNVKEGRKTLRPEPCMYRHGQWWTAEGETSHPTC